ncbi:Fpg/Nei family DNA glycosylase [Terriglobus tenax]|uniref:Fpg/Nei family DNA glycosylase n=1 Tax=Terriglobus tenax TaxID=1111115 RepID=UPI0021E0E5EC|nr:DNA-formamidopyrimidine glycosylase family protein [Terriglobus tenax]
MPEGDTIFRSARALAKALTGKAVIRFETALAPLQRVQDDTPITGRMVEKVESRGKWLLMYLSGDLILVTHMMMSGSWHIYRTGEKWWLPRKAMRVVIGVDGFEAVAFNVPVAEFHTARSLARHSAIPQLGPDLLDSSFTPQTGQQRLAERAVSHPEDEVAVVLLNQRVMAGLGNVYKSEVCFTAGVHPFRRMDTLTEGEMLALADHAQRYMQTNVRDGSGDGIVTYTGSRRTTHRADQEERLWVYGRAGEACRRCGTTILSRKQGVQARSTYWCPNCQPWKGSEVEPEGWAVKKLSRRTSC